mgnify:CR=1 FL=1
MKDMYYNSGYHDRERSGQANNENSIFPYFAKL